MAFFDDRDDRNNSRVARPPARTPARTPAPPTPPPAKRGEQTGAVAPKEAASPPQLRRGPLPDDLVDWIGFVRRQWWLMGLVWILAMALVVAALSVWPRQYDSSAKFLVKNARQDLVVGPTESATAAMREQLSETVLNTELELLKSRDILAKVVRDLNLQQPLIDAGMQPDEAVERAVRGLAGELSAGTIRKTNVIQVSYRSPDPQRAASIVGHLAETYLAAHLAIHSSPGTYEMFKRQAADASTELQEAEAALADLARSANLVSLEPQKQEALKSIQDMETQLNTLAAEAREHRTRERVAEVHMMDTPKRVPTTVRDMPNQSSVERLHTMLVEMQNKRTDALMKFKPGDRLILELDQQIADTTKALEQAQTMSAKEESTDINPAWQQLEVERTKARLQGAGLESKMTELRGELAAQKQRLLQIAEASPRYEQLVRKVTDAKSKYELFTKRQEEARIADVLDTQRISNVVLAQAPIASHVPSSPNVRLGLVAGAIGAAMLAAGIAFLREMLSTAWHARRHSKMIPATLAIVLLTARLAWPDAAIAGQQPPQPPPRTSEQTSPTEQTSPAQPAQPGQPSPLPAQPSPQPQQPQQPIAGSAPGASLADAVKPVDPATVAVASFYRLQPSDVIDVKYTYTPEYNATVMVRPDGYVTLPIVGEVAVARLTVREVKDAIVTQASQRLREPELTVELKDFQKPRFVVGGDVGKPGQFELRGRVTVLEAVAMAGGFKTSAKHSQVLLFRRFDQERAVTRIVDAKALTRAGSSMEDPLLLPGDFLFIPQNRISKVERFIPIQTIGWLLNIVL